MLTVGELAKQAHVNRETVRYYERRRLLPCPARSISGYRVFSEDALKRLKFIRHAKLLGFSLDEIKELLALRLSSVNACDPVRKRTQLKIRDIERKIQALDGIKRALSQLVRACSRRQGIEECPILDSLAADGNEHESRTVLHR